MCPSFERWLVVFKSSACKSRRALGQQREREGAVGQRQSRWRAESCRVVSHPEFVRYAPFSIHHPPRQSRVLTFLLLRLSPSPESVSMRPQRVHVSECAVEGGSLELEQRIRYVPFIIRRLPRYSHSFFCTCLRRPSPCPCVQRVHLSECYVEQL